MKYLTIALAVILSLFITVPAQAAKGSNTPTGTIELLTPLEYGKPFSVHWTFTGKEATSPRLRTSFMCWVGEHINSNIVVGWTDSAYYNLDGTHVVYEPTTDRTLSATLSQPFAGYRLYSPWDTEHTTEDADCEIRLYEWKYNLRNQVYVLYDSITAIPATR